MSENFSCNELIKQHQSAGRFFESSGVQSFVREEGEGEPVVCIHGVPASSFLYRNMLPELSSKGFKGIAFDFPGLGLAQRPKDFDYSWTGLGKWCTQAINDLEIDEFHLVIHDIGGPVGLEILSALHSRIKSLTILNTMILVDGFAKPWMMRPFGWKGFNKLYLASINGPVFKQLMHYAGVFKKEAIGIEEARAYVELLKGKDNGNAFLNIMTSFEPTAEKQALYLDAIKKLNAPKQFIWGVNDPALSLNDFGLPAQKATEIDTLHKLPGKHFLQEDFASEIASHIDTMVNS